MDKRFRIDEKVVVDSADVQRAAEIAVKRQRAKVRDLVVDGKIVDEEILLNTKAV